MSFKNLEKRYNETVKELYAGATTKFDNGVPSNGRNDDPLIVRKPGQGYWTFAESRSTPVTSAIQDVKRLTLFTSSRRGVSFLLKQQLLQTGNTFESTRLINPVFHIANAVPFLHVKRMVDVPITAGGVVRSLVGDNAITRRLFGSGAQKTDYVSLRKIGQLQQETYNKAVGKKDLLGGVLKKIPVIGQTISAVKAKRSVGDSDDVETRYILSRPELAQSGGMGQVGQIAATAGRLLGNSLLQFGGNVARLVDNQYIVWKHRSDKNKFQTGQSTIFDVKYGPTSLYGNFDTYLDFSDNKGKWSFSARATDQTPTLTLSATATSDNLENKYKKEPHSGRDVQTRKIEFNIEKQRWYEEDAGGDGQLPFLKYFRGGLDSISDAGQLDLNNSVTTNAKYIADARVDKGTKISYITDPSNDTVTSERERDITFNGYSLINADFEDSINVSFAMANDKDIKFRAYIRDLTQTATPEYNSYQYVGRIEKFITYTSVQRQIAFKLGLLAFSKNEIDGVWRRLNYLTGMVFPYGYVNGIYQPNIVRITIGDVYTNQPGYIISLNTNFNQISESWELDSGKQVPIAAEVDVQFMLIEKNAKVASSPFYGITENLEGFSNPLAAIPTEPPGDIPDNPESDDPSVVFNTSLAPFGSQLSNVTRVGPRSDLIPRIGTPTILSPTNPFASSGINPFLP